VLQRALRSKRATSRDKFVACACLGRAAAEQGKLDEAVKYFQQAASIKPARRDRFIPKAMPRIYRSLAAVSYMAGQYATSREFLEKTEDLPDDKKRADKLLRGLRLKPELIGFSAKLGRIVTDYDLRISATLATKASPAPITAKNVRLTLVNTTTRTSQAIPFHLVGSQLHALLLNVPQGAHRVECQITDSIGNRSEVASKRFDIDREPPRVLDRSPAPGAKVGRLRSIDFRLFDALGSVDFDTLQVSLKYPRTAKSTMRLVVSRGRYMYPSADGTIQKGTAARDKVTAPVPPESARGTHIVLVRVRDVEGRLSETEWSFDLR
jgi:hypothetical protein